MYTISIQGNVWDADTTEKTLPSGGIVHVDVPQHGRLSLHLDNSGGFQLAFISESGNRYDSLVSGNLYGQPEAWEKAPSDVVSHRNRLQDALTTLVCRLDALAASQAKDLTNFGKGKDANMAGMPRMLKKHMPAIDCKCGVHTYGFDLTCADVTAAIDAARGMIKI